MIHVDPIEVQEPSRPSMCDIAHDLQCRMDILLGLSDEMQATLQAVEKETGLSLSASMRLFSYQLYEVLETVSLLSTTHERYGWVLDERTRVVRRKSGMCA